MPGLTVLLIDTDGQDYETLAAIFRGGGYDVRPPAVGEGAVPAALSHPPDLIILNIQTEAGFKRFRTLKNLEGVRYIPILVLLPRFSEDYAARCLEIGADDFILKPFHAREVLARAGVALRVKQHENLVQASQERYRRLFEDSPESMFFTTREGRLWDCNPALVSLLGYDSKDEMLRLETARDFFYSPEDYRRFQEQVGQGGAVADVKVNLRHREGHKVTVLIHGYVMGGESGSLVGIAAPEAGEEAAGGEAAAASPELAGRPAIRQSLLNLINRLLPFAGNFLSVMKLTELLGGRYEKLRKLGQGSYGEVWLVQDTEPLAEPRHYIAKIPFSRGYNRSFRKEADICGKLAPHPGAVRLVETFEDGGKLILIQEYVAGQTLQDLLVEELPDALKERIILKLIEVVAHAHAQRIIHRDIKPNNIIVGPGDTVKLLDYGAAKDLKDRDISATMVGSRPYMAPEQIMGKSQRRSDIWALGVIMYLLYTGLLPFYDDSEKVLIDMILEDEPTPPREENPEIDPEMERIILKCLKKNVEERYPEALALKEDLLTHFPRFGSIPITEVPQPPRV